MDRIERIDSPRPHERTWAVTPARERDAEREREERRRKKREEQSTPPTPDDGEPPHLIDVRA